MTPALARPKIWLKATRPKTLTAAVVPVVVGTALAHAAGFALRWDLAIFSLLSALSIQIGTNFINDAIDFRKGTDNEKRIGPLRATQSGLLSERSVMAGGLLCFALAAIFAVPLLIQGGWVILSIGILSLLCGYSYTGGPFPLAYLGLGEIFVLLFFGWVAVLGVYFLQTGQADSLSLIAGTQIGLLATVLIAVNNLRDSQGDRQAKKRTLAVRFGKGFGRAEIAGLCLIPFTLGWLWWERGFAWAAILPLLALPLALQISWRIARTEPGPVYNQYLAKSALLHMTFGALLSLGYCLR